MTSKGKTFESYCKDYLKKQNYYVIRLRDTSLVNGRKTKGTQNPCDYIAFTPQNTVILECKACKEDRLPISRITQLGELKTLSEVYSQDCYIAVHFYERKLKVVINVKDIQNQKSIRFDDVICKDFKDYFMNMEMEGKKNVKK